MRIALCQLPLSSVPAVNPDRVRAAVADAARQGAALAAFPEGTQARCSADLRAVAEPQDSPLCRGLCEDGRHSAVATCRELVTKRRGARFGAIGAETPLLL
jgi:predicted amidohydrolase